MGSRILVPGDLGTTTLVLAVIKGQPTANEGGSPREFVLVINLMRNYRLFRTRSLVPGYVSLMENPLGRSRMKTL